MRRIFLDTFFPVFLVVADGDSSPLLLGPRSNGDESPGDQSQQQAEDQQEVLLKHIAKAPPSVVPLLHRSRVSISSSLGKNIHNPLTLNSPAPLSQERSVQKTLGNFLQKARSELNCDALCSVECLKTPGAHYVLGRGIRAR